jgi:hypothetical protein
MPSLEINTHNTKPSSRAVQQINRAGAESKPAAAPAHQGPGGGVGAHKLSPRRNGGSFWPPFLVLSHPPPATRPPAVAPAYPPIPLVPSAPRHQDATKPVMSEAELGRVDRHAACFGHVFACKSPPLMLPRRATCSSAGWPTGTCPPHSAGRCRVDEATPPPRRCKVAPPHSQSIIGRVNAPDAEIWRRRWRVPALGPCERRGMVASGRAEAGRELAKQAVWGWLARPPSRQRGIRPASRLASSSSHLFLIPTTLTSPARPPACLPKEEES